MNKKFGSRAAFSLLELMIAIALLLFATASAYVVLRNQLLGNLESDAQIISDRIEEAQTRSIAALNGTGWGIHFDNASTTPFYSLFSGLTYASSASSTYYLSGLVQFGTPASGSTTDIIFSKLTGEKTGTTTIVIDLKNATASKKTIIVSPQGQITVQ